MHQGALSLRVALGGNIFGYGGGLSHNKYAALPRIHACALAATHIYINIHSTAGNSRWVNGTCNQQCVVRIWPCPVCNGPQPPCDRPQSTQCPHGLGATKSMCGFPGNRRCSAHFQNFAVQTQQWRAPRSVPIARPARSMHTAHTHIRYQLIRIREHAHRKHSNVHLAIKSNRMHCALHMNQIQQIK